MKPRVLKSGTPEFRRFLEAIIARRGGGSRVDAAVSDIIADVRKRGERLSSLRAPVHNCEPSLIAGAGDDVRETSSVHR